LVEDDPLASIDKFELEPLLANMDLIPNMDRLANGLKQGNHIIIPYVEFKSFMDNFECAVCHDKVSRAD
jgi:hypothetical protein